MTNETTSTISCDVLIVGGGINGCGIAADATSRGLNVVLCEQGDLGQATSSASSKLIHGGLRYLEQYDFKLVRKALQERERLFKLCPHLIKPLSFVLPHCQQQRPAWLMRLGLFIYDHLCKTNVPRTKLISRKNQPMLFAPLKAHYQKGFNYYDAHTLDSRLVISNALQAKQSGATILPRTKFISTKRHTDYWLSTLQSANQTLSIKSKGLVNAAGPWAMSINQLANLDIPYQLSLVQGSHIVVPKLYDGDHAYILQNDDQRIVFAIPYFKNFTLVGTTDVMIETLSDAPQVKQQEIDYLLTLIKNYFAKTLSHQQIIHTYCGVRPLLKPNATLKAKEISRDYKVIHQQQPETFYSCILGGKLTTYRCLAQECVDGWRAIYPDLADSKTSTIKLPGSDFEDLHQLKASLTKRYPFLSTELIEHYIQLYGSRAYQLLEEIHNLNDLGQYFGGHLYQREVDFLIKEEWACDSDDILWRRTKEGLLLTKEQTEQLKVYLKNTINN